MTDKEAFERIERQFTSGNDEQVERANIRLQDWQAAKRYIQTARAQGGEVEKQAAITDFYTNNRRSGYTHPQPAQQGSMPEGWKVWETNGSVGNDMIVEHPDGKPRRFFNRKVEPLMFQFLQALTATPQPEGDGCMPSLEWAVKRCHALQSQGFERVRLDVLEKTFTNAIESHRPQPPQRSKGDE